MPLYRLRPGQRFRVEGCPELLGELVKIGEGSATIDWIGAPSFDSFQTASGRTVCIERSGRKRTTITRYCDVTPL